MSRSRSQPLAVVVLVAMALLPHAVQAADFLVFPVKVSLPVRSVIIGVEYDQVVKSALKEKDLVNLALGRALGSKVDQKTEVLAVALTSEGPSPSPQAQLIVFDPSQTDIAAVKAVVAAATALDFDFVPGGRGQGTVSAVIQQTTHGTPAENALNATTMLTTGAGTVGSLVPPGLGTAIALKGVVTGRVSFRSTVGGQLRAISGFIVDGKAKVSGKVLGSFSR